MKSRVLKAALAATALSVLSIGAAHAGQIVTPAIFTGSGNQIICVATNITNQTIMNVSVRIYGVLGTEMVTCDIEPHDGGGCQAFRNNDAGYCAIVVAGLTNAQVAARLRGSLMARRTTSPFTIDAVVQAQ